MNEAIILRWAVQCFSSTMKIKLFKKIKAKWFCSTKKDRSRTISMRPALGWMCCTRRNGHCWGYTRRHHGREGRRWRTSEEDRAQKRRRTSCWTWSWIPEHSHRNERTNEASAYLDVMSAEEWWSRRMPVFVFRRTSTGVLIVCRVRTWSRGIALLRRKVREIVRYLWTGVTVSRHQTQHSLLEQAFVLNWDLTEKCHQCNVTTKKYRGEQRNGQAGDLWNQGWVLNSGCWIFNDFLA